MIAKLEWTQSNAQQNIEQLKIPTMGVPINNESTTTDSKPFLPCSVHRPINSILQENEC